MMNCGNCVHGKSTGDKACMACIGSNYEGDMVNTTSSKINETSPINDLIQLDRIERLVDIHEDRIEELVEHMERLTKITEELLRKEND